MKPLFYILCLFASISAFAQNRASVYREVEELIIDKDTLFNNIDTSFSPQELIGRTITEKYEEGVPEDDLYFINDKHFLFINYRGEKTLGTYKFKVLKNIPFIILLGDNGERSTNYEAIIVKKGTQEYEVDWGHSYHYVYTSKEQDDKDVVFKVDDEIVPEFNFSDDNVSFDILNRKIGINYKGEKIIDNVCDSLKIYWDFAITYSSRKTSLYNLNGKLLRDNVKSIYQYSHLFHQIIDAENKMYYIDTLGKRFDAPTKYRSMWGNDTNANRTVNYYAHKTNILKIAHKDFSTKRYEEPGFYDSIDLNDFMNLSDFETAYIYDFELVYTLYMLQRDALNFDSDERWVNVKELEAFLKKIDAKELLLLKKIFTEEEYMDKLSFFLLSEFTSSMITLPRRFKKIRFVNNSTTQISAEDYWYNVAFYKPLDNSHIIARKSGKYGVWDIEEEKEILSFNYKNITPKKGTHLLLKKNDLFTYYPYIGSQPKYSYLSDYTEYYARFIYPDGKKGWVDRKGNEFFDE